MYLEPSGFLMGNTEHDRPCSDSGSAGRFDFRDDTDLSRPNRLHRSLRHKIFPALPTAEASSIYPLPLCWTEYRVTMRAFNI